MTSDRWSSGDAYESYVGRWSRLVAREFVRWLDVPAGRRWVDVGCGTGALTETVLRDAAPARVLGVEPAAPYAGYARQHVTDRRATFAVAGATALPVGDAAVDVVVSGLVLNFVAEPAVAVAEARRAVRPGGRVAAYVWDYADGMGLMRHFWDAAGELDPAARELDEGRRFPLCRPDRLADVFGGLDGVEVRDVTVPTTFADFDDYWTPFLRGQGPAPTYVASLDPARQASLREALRDRLAARADASIALTARAWAVRGLVP